MNYNSKILENNASLGTILSAVNAMPRPSFQEAVTITPGTANQVAVPSNYYTKGAVTVKGDANLVASNIKSGVSIFGVNGTLTADGGSNKLEDAFVTRSALSGIYSNSRVFVVGSYALAHTSITKANFLKVLSISAQAFYSCKNLSMIAFPKATNVKTQAFYGCASLQSLDFPVCSEIGTSAFGLCSKISQAIFPKLLTISNSAFAMCYALRSISAPICSFIGAYAFSGCSALETVRFPKCTFILTSAFARCSSLRTAYIPLANSISSTFSGCATLSAVVLSNCSTIIGAAFTSCYNLISLYLLGQKALCNLSVSAAFSSTPIAGYSASAGTYGSIYVPSSMLTAYRNATNWTYFSSRFVGINPSLSTFGIVNTYGSVVTVQGEFIMTWQEWVKDYGGAMFSISNTGYVHLDASTRVCDVNGSKVYGDDIIELGTTYYLTTT